jgi:predicted ATP-dependent protease
LLRQMLEQIQLACPAAPDRCYVHDFERPDRPKLLSLPQGRARPFQRRIDGLIEFVREDLLPALAGDAFRERREVLNERLQEQISSRAKPLEEELAEKDLTLISVQVGALPQLAIVPVIDGRPTPPELFERLVAEGKITEEKRQQIVERIGEYRRDLEILATEIDQLQATHRDQVRRLFETETRAILGRAVSRIEEEFPYEETRRYVAAIVEDVVSHRLGALRTVRQEDFTRLYRVNVLVERREGTGCPVVVEHTPNLQNLFGGIDREPLFDGGFRTDHLMIRAGSLLRADGGYLLLEARDVLSEPGVWRALMRTLRTGVAEIVQPELSALPWSPALKPEPIQVAVKVILIGDPDLYYLLDAYEPDFAHLFKVLADFETSLPRSEQSVGMYAGVLAKISKEEELLPFDRNAVAALAEHGARIASRSDRLTARFGRLADIAREAAFLARKGKLDLVDRDCVRTAVRNTKRRADLPARRFRRLVAEGTIRIEVQGQVIGQVNGLAVVRAGSLAYGFPARITATIGPGSAGAVNIEREAQLSGAIHTKGFYILGGLLRHLLRTPHPFAFSASIAFEQSYGGIDGDSASGAEICCLLSALTEVPLRQDLAMTGAIDQHGHVQAIGAVNEKIEGFYDTCVDVGLTGKQGVIIPRANAVDLMLREDVVRACEEGRFHVYAVDCIQEALELFTEIPAGKPDEHGIYPEGSFLRQAMEQSFTYWRLATPESLFASLGQEESDEENGGEDGDDPASPLGEG